MANTIDDLRKHLFDTLAALKDKEAPMEIDRARVVAEVAKQIIESAKVEVQFLKVSDAVKNTGFMPAGDSPVPVGRRQVTAGSTFLHAGGAPGAPAAGDRCVLCDIRLTTPSAIERGLCGSCSDRPEAQTVKPRRKSA